MVVNALVIKWDFTCSESVIFLLSSADVNRKLHPVSNKYPINKWWWEELLVEHVSQKVIGYVQSVLPKAVEQIWKERYVTCRPGYPELSGMIWSGFPGCSCPRVNVLLFKSKNLKMVDYDPDC